MARFGVTPEDLDADHLSTGLRDLLAFQADRARGYYEQAAELLPLVEPVGRPVLLTIVGIYRALLDEIIRRDYNVLCSRATVPSWRKALIALTALPRRFTRTAQALSTTPVS